MSENVMRSQTELQDSKCFVGATWRRAGYFFAMTSAAASSEKIDRKGLAVFLWVAFGLAWPIITVGDYLWPGAIAASIVHGTAMLMPGLACVVVKRWVAKGDFRGIGLRAVSGRVYLLVILACCLLWAVPQGIDFLVDGGVRDYSNKRFLFTVALLLTGLIPAFGEELGWRGYLLPGLLPIGHRKALLLHGAIWGAWHWPLLFPPLLRGEINTLQCILGMMAMVPASAVLGTIVGWLWLRFGSILLVTVWHFSYNFFRDTLNLWLEPGENSDLLGLFPIVVILVAAVILLGLLSRKGERPTSAQSASSGMTTSYAE
jgi:membrane protease YdiL (CAAX protease family)